jgi:hypothetical protein
MGGDSFADYERAYREAKGKSIVPASALKSNEGVPVLKPSPGPGKERSGLG